MLKLFVIMFFFSLSGHAARFKWEIQITDPQFELNYKTLGDEKYRPYLKKTSWRCDVTPIEQKHRMEMRKLHCNYSVEKTGTVTTLLSCGDKKDYNEVTFELFDERKNLTFLVMLLCRKK